MSNNQKEDSTINYGFIKPTKEQAVYTSVLLGVVILCCMPFVRNIMVIQVSLSQWILFVFSFGFPILSIIRMNRNKDNFLGEREAKK